MGQLVNGNQTAITRISISTSSLEMLVGSFMIESRDTHRNFLLGDYNATYDAPQSSGKYGYADYTFRTAISKCEPICFNQSK